MLESTVKYYEAKLLNIQHIKAWHWNQIAFVMFNVEKEFSHDPKGAWKCSLVDLDILKSVTQKNLYNFLFSTKFNKTFTTKQIWFILIWPSWPLSHVDYIVLFDLPCDAVPLFVLFSLSQPLSELHIFSESLKVICDIFLCCGAVLRGQK